MPDRRSKVLVTGGAGFIGPPAVEIYGDGTQTRDFTCVDSVTEVGLAETVAWLRASRAGHDVAAGGGE